MLYTSASIGMAGCCDGSDYQSCGWATTCMDYDTYWSSSSCDSDCESNTFIRKCSGYAQPYCVTWTYPGDNVKDFGCAASSSYLIETVLQSATDDYYSSFTTSMTLPTISGDAVAFDLSTADGTTATDTYSDIFDATETSDIFEESTSLPSGGGGSRKKKAKVSISVIIGAVVGGLVLLFFIGAIVIFICVKQKKKKQLANNQQAIAAAQANHPQPQFQQPMQQQQPGFAPMPPQTPPPMNEYFKPGMAPSPQPGYAPPMDQKHGQVNEYPIQTPVSNPTTPAPAYIQPYYAAPGTPPPMPAQSPAPYQNRGPTPGAHEVDAISAPQNNQGQGGQVYEIGGGR